MPQVVGPAAALPGACMKGLKPLQIAGKSLLGALKSGVRTFTRNGSMASLQMLASEHLRQNGA